MINCARFLVLGGGGSVVFSTIGPIKLNFQTIVERAGSSCEDLSTEKA